jgi:hypothetical protein
MDYGKHWRRKQEISIKNEGVVLLFCALLQKHPFSQRFHKVCWKHFSEFMGLWGKYLGQAGSPRRRNCYADVGLTLIVGGIRGFHTVWLEGWPQDTTCPENKNKNNNKKKLSIQKFLKRKTSSSYM